MGEAKTASLKRKRIHVTTAGQMFYKVVSSTNSMWSLLTLSCASLRHGPPNFLRHRFLWNIWHGFWKMSFHFSFIRSNENESKRTRRFWSKANLFPSYLDRQDVYTLFLSKGSISIQGMACIQLGVPASASKVFYLHDYWKYFLVVFVLQSRARCVTFTNILILLHAVVVNIECTLVIILLQKLPLFLLLGLILFQFSKKRQKVLI